MATMVHPLKKAVTAFISICATASSYALASPLTAEAFDSSALIQQEIDFIEAELENLPNESLNLTPWTLGYRSEAFTSPENLIEIEIQFRESVPLDLITLMPAAYTEDGKQLQAFGFPKRFTIERFMPNGDSEIIVDFSRQDYTINGIEPQLFRIQDIQPATGLRIRITKLSANKTWAIGDYRAALAEVMAFAGPYNAALNQKVRASSSSDYAFIWSPDALTDGFLLHSPVSRELGNPNEVSFRIRHTERVILEFEFSEAQVIDEFHFWPLLHDLQFNYPPTSGLGFPKGIKILGSEKPDFSDSITLYNKKEVNQNITFAVRL